MDLLNVGDIVAVHRTGTGIHRFVGTAKVIGVQSTALHTHKAQTDRHGIFYARKSEYRTLDGTTSARVATMAEIEAGKLLVRREAVNRLQASSLTDAQVTAIYEAAASCGAIPGL